MPTSVKIFRGGIEPPHHKKTAELATVKMPLPSKVIIPMLQHIGAPCTPLVKKGDRVLVGEKIGAAESFISAPIHASVSGIVADVKPILYSNGAEVMAVEITPDGQQELHESVKPLGKLERTALLEKIKESGIVGLGGAGFPTQVKLNPPPDKKLDLLVINGAECEPYITADYREMIENPEGILEGIKLVMELTGIKQAYLGIEANKPTAIQKLRELAREFPGVEVVSLKTRYPQGGEKQLIYAVTGRTVPMGALPAEVGVLVQNVNTVSFLASYLKTGLPLIKKKVTVEGGAVKTPMNVEVLIGTPLKEVFEFCGGFTTEPQKIIMGGPMMGVAQFSPENPVLKQTNALLALTAEETKATPESVCIRCGKCVAACPMELMPLQINACVTRGKLAESLQYHLYNCIECGCCSYVCPAGRNLVQSVRYAKSEIKRLGLDKK